MVGYPKEQNITFNPANYSTGRDLLSYELLEGRRGVASDSALQKFCTEKYYSDKYEIIIKIKYC